MNWDYIAGFFDGGGNIHILKTKTYENGKHNLAIAIRIYQTSKDILEEIKNFIGYGAIYQHRELFELTFVKKENVKDFLLNIKDKVIAKKGQVNYLLENYHFEKSSNENFDVDKFRSFIVRKNVDKFRTLHTTKKEEKESETQNS